MRWSSLTALEGELTAHPKMDGTFRAVGSCILPMNSPAGGSPIPSCQAAITLKRYLAHFGRGLRSASGRSPQRPRARGLILFIDAIDNAARHAGDRKEDSFPTLLLESFHRSGPVPGVKLVVSCRSHHIQESVRDVPYKDFELRPFTLPETTSYVLARLPDVSDTEIRVAQARSAGNARILEHLVTSDRGLLDLSEIDQPIALDELLTRRIEDALAEGAESRLQESRDQRVPRRTVCLASARAS